MVINTTGDNNIAIGAVAMQTNITGSNNTCIGYYANTASNNLYNATAIGANAIVGASHSLVLGGTGANAVKVGIGTTTPTQKLQVDGGHILVRGVGNFTNAGDMGLIFFGDESYYIRSIKGYGLTISAYGAPDAIILQQNTGNVGMGTDLSNNTGNYKLLVEGKIAARGFTVTTAYNWPDYVFSEEYEIMPLNELERFVNQNKHLPNVPSADEVKLNGINLGEMDVILLKKVEELTIYIIEQNKKIESLQKEVDELKISNYRN